MDDYGLQVAEESLGKLEREYKRIYSQAAKEMREKQRKFLKEFEREKAQRLAALDTTEKAEKAYKAWLREQTLRSDWLDDMVDELSRKATTANEVAVATLLDKVPGVYATNANYEAYSIEKALKARTAFTLVDEDTVRNLVTGRGSKAAVAGRLLPEVTFPKVDRPKDYRWNRQKFTSAITQGILQGESIPNIVKRTESIFGSNQAAAYRAARTAVGSAQNSGRYFSMLRAEDMGIIVTKKWIATHDDRTRMSHRMLDGQEVPVKEPFDSEHGPIDYPNDPAADPAEVYNCRCSIKEEVGGFEPLAESYERWLEIQGMDYEEWEAAVASGKAVAHQVVDGKDILGTWQRRPDQFDFEIEDVINAQGFDGKPRVVGAEDFDKAVKQANGGKGLVMQRTYSAPTQEVLDSYREQLYSGKWYVDCSVNGSTYGRGMYATPSWNGAEVEGLRQAADFYSKFNASSGLSYSYTEMMTLDSSARIVDYADIKRKFDAYRAGLKAASQKASQELREEASESFLKSLVHSAGIEPSRYDDALYFLKANTGRVQGDWNKMSQAANALGENGRQVVIGLQQRAAMEEHDFVEKYLAEHLSSAGIEDVGSYAVSLGYDAIRADQGVGGGEVVVLNRTKLIIRRPE